MPSRDQDFMVAIRACQGCYTYRIYTAPGEPGTISADTDSFSSPDGRARPGYEAIAATAAPSH
jgi:hypothetical protein